MNFDVRVLLSTAERALRNHEPAEARAAFLEAGLAAASYQLRRTAIRCYRLALELNLVDPEPIARILQLPPRTNAHMDWKLYAHALERHAWPAFSCRSAHVLTGGFASRVECPGIGTVMELIMPADDLIETRPDPRLTGMPLAMALVILRRAMWIAPRDHADAPQALRVAFDGFPSVRLSELGDWESLASSP